MLKGIGYGLKGTQRPRGTDPEFELNAKENQYFIWFFVKGLEGYKEVFTVFWPQRIQILFHIMQYFVNLGT